MPIELSDEQQAFVEAIRDFARREVGTREQLDALTDGGEHAHNRELNRRIAELGWAGVSIPEAYGGGGGGAVDMCLLLEETSRGNLPLSHGAPRADDAGLHDRGRDQRDPARDRLQDVRAIRHRLM
jgi:isovaleryl-CoA dehydrogenase